MDDLEEPSRVVREAYIESLVDPSPETLYQLEQACLDMDVAMETAYSVASNAFHIRCEGSED